MNIIIIYQLIRLLFLSKKYDKQKKVIDASGNTICVYGEIHLYNQKEAEEVEKLIDTYDVLVHEGVAYGKEISLFAKWSDKIQGVVLPVFYSIMRQLFKVIGRSESGFIKIADRKGREILGLEKPSKGISLVGITLLSLVLLTGFPFIFYQLLIVVGVLSSLDGIYSFVFPLLLIAYFLFSVYELEYKRNKAMAKRIADIAAMNTSQKILVGLGRAHLGPVCKYLISKYDMKLLE